MHLRAARRFSIGLAAGGAALALAACGDAKLERLSEGMSRDSVLAIINDGADGDSLARVYRQESYLLPNKKGNVFNTNILFYDSRGRKEAENPDVSTESMTPIVVQDGKVIGWGWTYYDSLAKANNIPLKSRK
jgi:hypothetical protein